MSDDADDAGPVVELGEKTPVEGAPLARVTARLHWPIEKSEIDRHEGESTIRTPAGPRTVSAILEEIDETYFQRRQEFESHVRDAIGTGPVDADDGPDETVTGTDDGDDADVEVVTGEDDTDASAGDVADESDDTDTETDE